MNTAGASGVKINSQISAIIADATENSGVYRFLDEKSNILYIGKAKNLKNRLQSYLRPNTGRIALMVSKARDLQIIITKSEAEALILEAKFIKAVKPEFNVLLKDDSAMSFVQISLEHPFPAIAIVRKKFINPDTDKSLYVGPFISNRFLYSTVNELIKLFKIRNCTDNEFKSRKRPCLQYHIGRCSAPCVGKVSEEEYQAQINCLVEVISGRTKALIKDIKTEISALSKALLYEAAAKKRDLMQGIQIMVSKYNSEFNIANGDVISIREMCGVLGVQIFLYRYGHFIGNKSFFFSQDHISYEDQLAMYEALLWQYYSNNEPPGEIIIDQNLHLPNLQAAIKAAYNKEASVFHPKRGAKHKAILFAQHNCDHAVKEYIRQNAVSHDKLLKLQELFKLSSLPNRVEVYDNSHIMGKYPVGAMVVMIDGKFAKAEYRRYYIQLAKFGGDDYGMLREVLERRCKRMKVSGNHPNLMIIDGGKGHLSTAVEVIKRHGLNIPIVAIAKSEFRNKGNERFFVTWQDEPITLDNSDPIMQYLQVMRDEAHNTAIKSHRNLRQKSELGI